MTLFFGCRTRALDLYADEKEAMRRAGVLSQTYLALSREPTIKKVIKYWNANKYFGHETVINFVNSFML